MKTTMPLDDSCGWALRFIVDRSYLGNIIISGNIGPAFLQLQLTGLAIKTKTQPHIQSTIAGYNDHIGGF